MTSKTEVPTVAPPPLLGGYRPVLEVYDEMLGQDGGLRPHWQAFMDSLERMGREEFTARGEGARRILREHGATYNVYGDAQGLDRPWALDLIPALIPAEEWRRIEAGLIQRARLLNLLLADIYGPQNLVRDGHLPPALLHANPGFLRSCHGVRPVKDLFLFMHAVDLARSPDGRWWVLADRTQAPSGAGYALENRIVLSRVLPDEFRDGHVQRLAHFFQMARDTLRSLAPRGGDHPNVVLLTPGPYNETYFEHVFLARYLGFQLVEGADLTVRDRRVYVKTLEGLQPVDVILRRVDDQFCDPLELRADSFLGVAGLLEAARAGNVAISNALGSGAVETPALMAFLPGLCQRLLNEDLKLPSVGTWWCGQAPELDCVLDRLDSLVIKRAFATGSGRPAFGAQLEARQRAELQHALRATPFDYVGQEQFALSATPAWTGRNLEPRPMVLRAFICAAGPTYGVLPGGLTRISASPNELVVSMQSGGGSKDTWVLAEGPVSQLSLLLPANQAVRLERAAAEVPSRVADNLFWLGRYAERLEDTVRTLRCLLTRLSGEAGAEENPELAGLVRLLVNLELLPARFRERYTLAGVEREAFLLIYQVHRLGTVREVLGRLKQIAFVLRDRFSADTWRIVNKLQVDASTRPGRIPAVEALALLNTLIVDLAAFSGMEMENMTRGHGWRFLDLGRRIERAGNVIALAQAALAVETEGLSALEPVLEIADSVMTYRRRYFVQPQMGTVLDLLIADASNPRALAFQIGALADHAANLPRENSQANRELRLVTSMQEQLTGANLEMPAGRLPEYQQLGDLLASLAADLRSLGDAITHHYFSHADTRAS